MLIERTIEPREILRIAPWGRGRDQGPRTADCEGAGQSREISPGRRAVPTIDIEGWTPMTAITASLDQEGSRTAEERRCVVGPSLTDLGNLTCWCRPMPRPSMARRVEPVWMLLTFDRLRALGQEPS